MRSERGGERSVGLKEEEGLRMGGADETSPCDGRDRIGPDNG